MLRYGGPKTAMLGPETTMLRQAQHTIEIKTAGPGLLEFTREAAAFIDHSGIETGLLTPSAGTPRLRW